MMYKPHIIFIGLVFLLISAISGLLLAFVLNKKEKKKFLIVAIIGAFIAPYTLSFYTNVLPFSNSSDIFYYLSLHEFSFKKSIYYLISLGLFMSFFVLFFPLVKRLRSHPLSTSCILFALMVSFILVPKLIYDDYIDLMPGYIYFVAPLSGVLLVPFVLKKI